MPRANTDTPSKRQKIRYVKMTLGGTSVIIEPRDVKDMTEGETDPYTLEDVWMTPTAFDKLRDFEGF